MSELAVEPVATPSETEIAPADAHVQDGDEFTVALLHEDRPTIDGREFAPGTVEWREPPLTLMYLLENTHDGHKGARAGASITRIWRDGSTIYGAGHFSSGPEGQELKKYIEEGVLNGVSSDVGGAIVESELAEDGSQRQMIRGGKIMGATVLPFPAFDDTRISVVASAVPEEPPRSWFTNPEFSGPTPLTVDDDGRIYGHAALWGTCHIGKQGTCLTPPHSKTDYGYFHTGAVRCDDGSQVPVGVVTLGTGHAALSLNHRAAAEHYDHTGTVVADVVTGEDKHGVWVSGSLRPTVTEARLRELRASPLSGDWRPIGGSLELVALLAVNTPGFPIPRARIAFSLDTDQELALVAAGVIDKQPPIQTEDKEIMETTHTCTCGSNTETVVVADGEIDTIDTPSIDVAPEQASIDDALMSRVESLEGAVKALAERSLSTPEPAAVVSDEKSINETEITE